MAEKLKTFYLTTKHAKRSQKSCIHRTYVIFAAVDPVHLWPMNCAYGLRDVIGGKDGVAYNVNLNLDAPVDLSGIESQIPESIASAYAAESYQFQGTVDSYVEIPSIEMDERYTYVAFIKCSQNGPFWEWTDPAERYSDHIQITYLYNTAFAFWAGETDGANGGIVQRKNKSCCVYILLCVPIHD